MTAKWKLNDQSKQKNWVQIIFWSMTIQESERKYEQDLKQQMNASHNASYSWVFHVFTFALQLLFTCA